MTAGQRCTTLHQAVFELGVFVVLGFLNFISLPGLGLLWGLAVEKGLVAVLGLFDQRSGC